MTIKNKVQKRTKIFPRRNWIEGARAIDKPIELIENHKISANVYTLYALAMALNVKFKDLFDF